MIWAASKSAVRTMPSPTLLTPPSRSVELASGVFGQEKAEPKEVAVDLNVLHAKIGELTSRPMIF